MAASVQVDTAAVVAGLRRLADGLERAPREVGYAEAQDAARRIRDGVPVLTGRLQSTVTARRTDDGAEVTYGSPATPYGRKIERRDGTVADVLPDSARRYERDMRRAAEKEVSSL